MSLAHNDFRNSGSFVWPLTLLRTPIFCNISNVLFVLVTLYSRLTSPYRVTIYIAHEEYMWQRTMKKQKYHARQFPASQDNCRARTSKKKTTWTKIQPRGWCLIIVCAMIVAQDISQGIIWLSTDRTKFTTPQKGAWKKAERTHHGRDRELHVVKSNTNLCSVRTNNSVEFICQAKRAN